MNDDHTTEGGGGGCHSHTNVLTTRVHHPLKWTLNGVSHHVSRAPLNGVIPAKNNTKWRVLIVVVLRNDTHKINGVLDILGTLSAMEHETHPPLKENVDDAVCLKNTLSTPFWGHGCVASHVAVSLPLTQH